MAFGGVNIGAKLGAQGGRGIGPQRAPAASNPFQAYKSSPLLAGMHPAGVASTPNPFHPQAPLLQGMHQVAATPVAPNSVQGGSATTPSTGNVSGGDSGPPLDSTYFNNIATNNAKLQHTIDTLGLQQQQAQTNLQNTLGNLDYQQPRDQLRLMQNANRNGALYSSVYGQNQGDLVRQYANQRTNAQTSFDQLAQRIANEIGIDKENTGIDNHNEYTNAIGRAAAAAAKDPSLGNSEPGAHDQSNSPGPQKLTPAQQNSLRVSASTNDAAVRRSQAMAQALRSKARTHATKPAPRPLPRGSIISG